MIAEALVLHEYVYVVPVPVIATFALPSFFPLQLMLVILENWIVGALGDGLTIAVEIVVQPLESITVIE